MSTFKTQELKNQAIAKQQKVVNEATPADLEVEKAKLAELKTADLEA